MSNASRYVIARENNVLRVDFRCEPDPPAPRFPGAAAIRNLTGRLADAFQPDLGKEVA
jgi:hypothetical protein